MQQFILTFLRKPALRLCRTLTIAAAALTLLAGAAGRPALAADLFAPAITVNDEVITRFELDQRVLFMQVLQFPGDPEKSAREQLIEERIKRQAAKAAGITADPEEVNQGIETMAARAQMSAEEFLKALEAEGIAPETVRDFISSSLVWRDLVTQKFLETARPSEDEINRAMGQGGSGGIRVLLSEIILPVTRATQGQTMVLAENIAKLRSFEEFSAAARQYSAAASRDKGGQLDWMPITDLPPGLQPVILELRPGEVTTPIQLPNAIALFQMRDIGEAAPGTPRYSAIEYAIYRIPGGRSPEALATARAIAEKVDTCDDLYGIAKGQPEEVLQRQSLAPAAIPRDIAMELAKLDEGEISTALTRDDGRTLLFVMLCGRTAEIAADATREDVANALTEQRLAMFGDSYLQQLLADARIVEK